MNYRTKEAIVHRAEVRMSSSVVSSSLWFVAGVLGIGTSLVFRIEPLTWAITIAIGILAVLVGSRSFLRADSPIARWPVALGIAWVSCYAALAVWQLDDPAALTTDVGLAFIGAAAAVVGRRPAVAAA